jgi:hypothetical protein
MEANRQESKPNPCSNMEHSSSMSYTHMLMNSSNPSVDPASASSHQPPPNIHPAQFAMNYPSPMHNSSIPHFDPQNSSSQQPTNIHPSQLFMNYPTPNLHPYGSVYGEWQ